MPASHTEDPALNEFSNQSGGPSAQNSNLPIAGSTDTNYVDSHLAEYQPLQQSTHPVKKFQRKQSTFVVTPVSILENDDIDASKPKLVSLL